MVHRRRWRFLPRIASVPIPNGPPHGKDTGCASRFRSSLSTSKWYLWPICWWWSTSVRYLDSILLSRGVRYLSTFIISCEDVHQHYPNHQSLWNRYVHNCDMLCSCLNHKSDGCTYNNNQERTWHRRVQACLVFKQSTPHSWPMKEHLKWTVELGMVINLLETLISYQLSIYHKL